MQTDEWTLDSDKYYFSMFDIKPNMVLGGIMTVLSDNTIGIDGELPHLEGI